MGGIQTWLAAAADERVKVLVPAIAVQSFRWSLDNDRWQGRANTIRVPHEAAAQDLGEPKVNARVCRELWAKVVPASPTSSTAEHDPAVRRPALLVLNGDQDPNCPIGGAPDRHRRRRSRVQRRECVRQAEGDCGRGRGPQGHGRAAAGGLGLAGEVARPWG